MRTIKNTLWITTALVALIGLATVPAAADQVILDDLIVDGSICAGLDCVNGESFGFDTLRLKENNLRIRAVDTSNSASFPTFDWQITFNESTNGGANKFSIEDLDSSRTPFTIEGGAPNHSLYVDDGGRIGLSTSTPVVELHIVDGDTPTLRLEQDGSSGFTPQTWDVAGNETNFFVRDATNGSTLPFRIRPSAPSNSIFVDTDGDVGMGTSAPAAELHVSDSDAVFVQVSSTGASNAGATYANSASTWTFFNSSAGNLRFNATGGIGQVLEFNHATGDVEIVAGDLTIPAGDCSDQAGGGGCTPDYVFEPEYELLSLGELKEFIAENKHLPNVPSAADNERSGIQMRRLSFAMLEKIEELVLYTLEQQETIETLNARLAAIEESE